MKIKKRFNQRIYGLLSTLFFMCTSTVNAGTLAIAPPPTLVCPMHHQTTHHGIYHEIGHYHGALPLLSGEGKNLTLSWVMKNTVPHGWRVVYGQGFAINMPVAMKGKYTWTGRLRYLANHYNLNITVNFNHHTVTLTKGK